MNLVVVSNRLPFSLAPAEGGGWRVVPGQKRHIGRLIGEINGEFTRSGWAPTSVARELADFPLVVDDLPVAAGQ